MTCPVLFYPRISPSNRTERECIADERAIWLWGDSIPMDSPQEWLLLSVPPLLWALLVVSSSALLFLSRSCLAPLFPSSFLQLAISPLVRALDSTDAWKDLTTPRGSRLACLDRYRIFAMVWVFCNHLGSEGRVDILERLPSAEAFKTAVHTDPVLGALLGNSALGVEVFLVLSGILIAKGFRRTVKGPVTHWALYLLRRSIRLWLVMAPFLLIAVGPLLRLLLPRFHGTMLTACGWKGLQLHLTFRGNQQDHPTCLGYLWYLGLDFQLHLLVPLVVIVLWKWRSAGLALVVFLVGRSIYMRGVHCMLFSTCNASDVDIPFIHIASLSTEEMERMYRGLWGIYSHVSTKAGPFLLAVVVGVWEAEGVTITKRYSTCLFWGGLTIGVATIYAILPQYWWPDMDTNLYNLAYTASFRTIFSLAVLAMIASSALSENPTPIHWGTSALAKLCYCAYLLHMPLVYIFNYLEVFQRTESAWFLPLLLLVHAPLTFFCALIFHLLVEAPATRITSLIIPHFFAVSNRITQPIDRQLLWIWKSRNSWLKEHVHSE